MNVTAYFCSFFRDVQAKRHFYGDNDSDDDNDDAEGKRNHVNQNGFSSPAGSGEGGGAGSTPTVTPHEQGLSFAGTDSLSASSSKKKRMRPPEHGLEEGQSHGKRPLENGGNSGGGGCGSVNPKRKRMAVASVVERGVGGCSDAHRRYTKQEERQQ